MLETFKARLKAKLKATGVNLSQKRIDAIADRLHKKNPDLTEESDHDEKLDDYNDLNPFSETAAEDDRIRTLEARAKKQPAKTDDEDEPGDEPAPATPPKKKKDEMPEWFKPFAEKITAQEQEKTQATLKGQAAKLLEGIPEIIWKRAALPEKAEDLEAWAAEIKSDYEATPEVHQTAQRHRPPVGSGEASKKKASEEQVSAVVNKL
jgi:hypothetical protein